MSLLQFALSLALGLLRAFTISCLWSWFVTPFGLPDVRVAHAYGLVLIHSTLSVTGADAADIQAMRTLSKDDKEMLPIANTALLTLQTLVCLELGYLVHTFFGA